MSVSTMPPWHWADASGEQLILVGLPAGPQQGSDYPRKRKPPALDQATVKFEVPERDVAKNVISEATKLGWIISPRRRRKTPASSLIRKDGP